MSISTTIHSPVSTQALTDPRDRGVRLALRVSGVIGFAALAAVCAQVSFPIPGTPVPVTLQTLAVTLGAIALGPRLGALSMALYLLVGMLGVPVFADASGGWSVVFGATGGYLLAFMVVPPMTSFALRGRDGAWAGWRGLLAQVILANIVIFTLGVAWLAFAAKLDVSGALNQGLYPFLPGTVIKSAMALALGGAIGPWAMKRVW